MRRVCISSGGGVFSPSFSCMVLPQNDPEEGIEKVLLAFFLQRVAQIYTHQRISNAVRPIESLQGFQRVELQPGESREVHFTLPARDLAYSSVQRHDS